jgi:hypothetical protein
MKAKEKVLDMETEESISSAQIRQCECKICQSHSDAQIIQSHHQINLLLSRMNEAQRRWYIGWLVTQPSSPSQRTLSLITGLTTKTIRKGRRELAQQLQSTPVNKQRRAGGGRKLAEKKNRS